MPILLEDFFGRFMRKEDLSYKKRIEFIEKDLDDLKNSVQKTIDEMQVVLSGFQKSISNLEEKGEWKPRFGDRVRFKHSFFGEMTGVVIESPFPSQYQVAFHDPSSKGDVKFYTVDIKDMEKIDD